MILCAEKKKLDALGFGLQRAREFHIIDSQDRGENLIGKLRPTWAESDSWYKSRQSMLSATREANTRKLRSCSTAETLRKIHKDMPIDPNKMIDDGTSISATLGFREHSRPSNDADVRTFAHQFTSNTVLNSS